MAKNRSQAVEEYLNRAKAQAPPLSPREKEDRLFRFRQRYRLLLEQFDRFGRELAAKEGAGDAAGAEAAREALEENYKQRRETVAELRALGENLTDMTDSLSERTP